MAEKHYITVSISNRRAIMRLRSSTVFQRAKTVCCPRVDIFSEAADSVTVETLSAVLVPPDMCDPTAWRSRIALRNVSVIMGLDTERHHSLHNVPAADGALYLCAVQCHRRVPKITKKRYWQRESTQGLRCPHPHKKSRLCISKWRLLMHPGRYLYSSAARFPVKEQCFGLEKII